LRSFALRGIVIRGGGKVKRRGGKKVFAFFGALFYNEGEPTRIVRSGPTKVHNQQCFQIIVGAL